MELAYPPFLLCPASLLLSTGHHIDNDVFALKQERIVTCYFWENSIHFAPNNKRGSVWVFKQIKKSFSLHHFEKPAFIASLLVCDGDV